MTALRLDNNSVILGGRAILRNVSCALAEGEVLGLLGPNGAGKSTLLRVMANLTEPQEGGVTCFDRPLSLFSRADLARHISYLPQDTTVHWQIAVARLVMLGRLPHRGVAWNIGAWNMNGRDMKGQGAVGGRVALRERAARDKDAVERAMTATDIWHLAERRVNTLSGGERLRVLLARALAVEAPILLADEPVAALDPYHQLQVMEILRAAAGQGRAIVVVMHDLTLASRFCDRLLLLRDGQVVAAGRPADVLTDDNLRFAYDVSVLRGHHRDQDYLLPWTRYAEARHGSPRGETTAQAHIDAVA